MKKLSEYRDEEALSLLADLIDPCVIVFSDEEFVQSVRSGDKVSAVKCVLKNNQSSVLEILALLEGVPKADYHCSLTSLPAILLSILNDAELLAFFDSQGQMMAETSSGSVTESTEGIGQD